MYFYKLSSRVIYLLPESDSQLISGHFLEIASPPTAAAANFEPV